MQKCFRIVWESAYCYVKESYECMIEIRNQAIVSIIVVSSYYDIFGGSWKNTSMIVVSLQGSAAFKYARIAV